MLGKDFSVGDYLLQEAKIYERLWHAPHPNICHYYGCILASDNQYFESLCLRKYRCTLREATTDDSNAINAESILDDIKCGLNHLHKLGFAYNDLNPENVMLDDNGRAVLIDFDACLPIGEEFRGRKCGTAGWKRRPSPTKSDRDNDLYAFALMKKHFIEASTGERLHTDFDGWLYHLIIFRFIGAASVSSPPSNTTSEERLNSSPLDPLMTASSPSSKHFSPTTK